MLPLHFRGKVDVPLVNHNLLQNFEPSRRTTLVLCNCINGPKEARVSEETNPPSIFPALLPVDFGCDTSILESPYDHFFVAGRGIVDYTKFHLGTFQRKHVLTANELDAVQKLLLHAAVRMDAELRPLHGIADLAHRVRPVAVGIDALCRHHTGHLLRRCLQLGRTLHVRYLDRSFHKDDPADFLLVGRPEAVLEIGRLGKLPLGDVGEHTIGLKRFVQIGLHSLPKIHHFISVRCDLKSFTVGLHANDRHIGQPHLVDRLHNLM
mmetsp:Transcript_7434/g.20653  ORF Transcript_7434/g.20653 Transcript_7434/m.20653 type:complete len:265 (-) Transcript_7434:165-959(-)